MLSEVALRYAQALYELAVEKGILDEAERQLVAVDRAIAAHPELHNLMFHPRVTAGAKKDTLLKVFSDDLSDDVRHFLLLLIDKHRETALPAIASCFTALANEARNVAPATVTSARPLTDEQQRTLAERLGAATGKRIALTPRVDPRIIGGVVVQMGDKLIDGSVARRLSSLKAALLQTEVTQIGVTTET